MAAEKKSALEKKLTLAPQSCWEIWSSQQQETALAWAEDYKEFLNQGKTERLVVKKARKMAEEKGFVDGEEWWQKGKSWTEADKLYFINRGKNIILVRRGKKPLEEGARFVLAHIDSPRLDLKLRPLVEEKGLVFFQTHYYGGIKKYQWTALPLALYGLVVREDGEEVEIAVGDQPGDPVFMVPDLLPHLAKKQLEKKLKEVITGEELTLLLGSIPLTKEKEAQEKIKLNLLQLLHQRYGIKEEDFVSADLEAVPAGQARDLGWDQSLIAAYGQDDRICAYSALQALLELKEPQYTAIVILTEKEETGSRSNTGITSLFWYDVFSRLLAREERGEKENLELRVRAALRRSEAISADVTAGFDPQHKDAFDEKNSAFLGYGIALEKYTGHGGKYSTNEAHAEYMARIRRIFNQAQVPWQPAKLGKIDQGGGGTVAMFLAQYNMDIVDAGPALLNMHAPFEISSKADLYATFLAYRAFFEAAD